MSKRIGLFVNGFDPSKNLKAGPNDIKRMYSIMTNEKYGHCNKELSTYRENIKSKKVFRNILDDSLSTIGFEDQFIFYFSGHGEYKGSVYHLKFGTDLISFNLFLAELESAQITKAIIILDSCFSGSITNAKNNSNDINLVSLPEGIAFLASSSELEFSYEKDDKQFSIFTDLLCECIETGNGNEPTGNNLISILDTHTYIDKHNKDTEKQQKPKYKIVNAVKSIWLSKNITKKDDSFKRKLHELKKTHEIANTYYRQFEHKYESICIPSMNEFKNSNDHIIKGLNTDNKENGIIELDKARFHLIRAINDIFETSAVLILEKLMEYNKIYHNTSEVYSIVPNIDEEQLEIDELKNSYKLLLEDNIEDSIEEKLARMMEITNRLEEIEQKFSLSIPKIDNLINSNNTSRDKKISKYNIFFILISLGILISFFLVIKIMG